MADSRPIAVTDSGVGGISVLRALRRLLPQENFLYFGDFANAPYGEKPTETVRALALNNAERLFDAGAKALVVACNTATGAAITALRRQFANEPIIGIEPALKPAVTFAESPTVLVMATPLTLRQDKFEQLQAQYNRRARILTLPCHGLVELIEQGITDGPAMERLLCDLLEPYRHGGIDAAVLGCTHYPLASEAIRRVLGAQVRLFEGGEGTAQQTRRLLAADRLTDSAAPGTVTWLGATPAQRALCTRLLEGE